MSRTYKDMGEVPAEGRRRARQEGSRAARRGETSGPRGIAGKKVVTRAEVRRFMRLR